MSSLTTPEVEAAWRETAAAVGGRFFDLAGPNIDAELDGVVVRAERHGYVASDTPGEDTLVKADAPFAGELTLKLYRTSALARLGVAVGMQDVITADRAFDERFVIKSNDEDLVRAWLGSRQRAALLLADRYTFALADRTLTARLDGLDEDPAGLRHAILATAALAAGGLDLERARKRLADTLGGTWEEDLLQTSRHGVACLIEWRREKKRWTTRLRASVPSPESPETVAARLTPFLTEAGVGVEGEHLVAHLLGIVVDPARLVPLLDSIAQAASASRGPYR